MKSTLERIATFNTEFEAEHAKQYLEQQGVPAFVDGSTAATVLSYFGSAVSGARLYVQSTDLQSALTLLKNLDTESKSEDALWYCTRCCEDVDAGFEYCWKCGCDRLEVNGLRPVESVLDSDQPKLASIFDASNIRQTTPSSNPYASPTGELMQNEIDSTNSDENAIAADEILERAWRATVIGFFLLPVVLHLYSMYLLISAGRLTSKFTSKGTRLFYGSLALNFLAGIIAGLVIQNVLVGFR